MDPAPVNIQRIPSKDTEISSHSVRKFTSCQLVKNLAVKSKCCKDLGDLFAR